jgi:SAM-dependent methyltransferase
MLINRVIIANTYLNGAGIEIGALHNPLKVPSNSKVEYVDRLCKSDLYRHYPELINLPLVDIDIIDDGENLSSFKESQLDFIIANHFLEHCENPILTLLNFYRTLKENGIVYLAIPNKELTFDKNRNRTPLDHLINDYLNGPESSRYDHYLEWAKFVDPLFGRIFTIDEEVDRALTLMKQTYSIHFHVWTSIDIIELFNYLNTRMNVYLEIIFFANLDDEMVFVLKKNSKPISA